MPYFTGRKASGCLFLGRGHGAFDRKLNCCIRICNSLDLCGIASNDRIVSFPLDADTDASSEKPESKDKACKNNVWIEHFMVPPCTVCIPLDGGSSGHVAAYP